MIPTHGRLLLPWPVNQDHVLKTLYQQQHNVKCNYDQQSGDLPPLEVGDKVQFRPNCERERRKAEVIPRSYVLEDEYGRAYKRNRRQIISVPNDSHMTPRSRAPPISTKPRNSPARTRQALVFAKPAPSPVTLERQKQFHTVPLQPDLRVKLRGCKSSPNCFREEM